MIDGQQRLTTVTLLIEALARALGDREPIDGFSAKKLRNYYLLNNLEEGDRRYKLILSQTDKTSMMALLNQQPYPKESSIRVEENFDFFKEKIQESKDDLEAICKGIAKLVIVDISLNRDQDNPQLIFESLNSTGRKLSQADLIRNFILMGQEPQLQTKLYEQYWRPIELEFGQKAYSTYFDSFMRHYLTIKSGEIPNIQEVYEAFKDYSRLPNLTIETLVADIQGFSKYYCRMALNTESDPELKTVFQDIRELNVGVAYPLLLELYYDYEHGELSKNEFILAARLVESYVFRRSVCNIPTNSMNKTFATFTRSLKKDRYLESIKANFLSLPSYRRFPNDEEFKRILQVKDLYNFRSRSYWLRRLENYDKKERVLVDEYTIEHILPQNENLSAQWKSELGKDWERIKKTYLHTLGNLTLTGYNSEYSDRPFAEKRDMENGFANSPMRLNKGLAKVDKWTEQAIQERSAMLANQAAIVWQEPKIEPSILKAYEKESVKTKYTIDDHSYLKNSPLRELFQAFRTQVLDFDPCVTEEFLKLYVAYKAETNFVDVVPQAKRLRLYLNILFPEINDPKQKCRDVTGLGRWGNGDVEVIISSLDELPYVIGLVRQAFEEQIGNNDSP